MADLLQLHILLPGGTDKDADWMHDQMEDFFMVPTDGLLTNGEYGLEIQSKLFERRDDNLRRVNNLVENIKTRFSSANLFRYEEEPHIGERIPVSDPDYHLVILVANQDINKPDILWRKKIDHFDTSPCIANGRIYHTNSSGVFALDGGSGDCIWKVETDNHMRVPGVGSDIVIASGYYSIVGIDSENGSIFWETEFDRAENNIHSQVCVGDQSAYLGLKNGEVQKITLDDGSRSVITEYTSNPSPVMTTTDGLFIFGDGCFELLDLDGSLKWSIDESQVEQLPLHGDLVRSDGGVAYLSAINRLYAISIENGNILWTSQIETDNLDHDLKYFANLHNKDAEASLSIAKPEDVSVFDNHLYVLTDCGVFCINRESGSIIEEQEIQLDKSIKEISAWNNLLVCVDYHDKLHFFESTGTVPHASFQLGNGCQKPVETSSGLVCVTDLEVVRLESPPTPM